MSNSKETWRNTRTNTTYTVNSDNNIKVNSPTKGISTINRQQFNRIKNGK